MKRSSRFSKSLILTVAGLLASGSIPALAQQSAAPTAQPSASATQPAATAPQPAVATPQPAKATKAKSPSSDQSGLGLGNHDSNAPIDIAADNFDYDLNAKIGTYTGNVIVIQGDMRMRSDKMKVNVVQGKPTHIVSTGHVVVTAPNGTATGDVGVYDTGPRTITMTGTVVLTKEKDVMRGTKLVMDMNTNLAHMYAQGMPGNRVHSLFIPQKKTDTSTGTAPAKKGETGTSAAPSKKTGKKASKPAATGTPATDPPPQ